MLKRKTIKKVSRQILAITEKNLFLEFRVKAQLITRFLNPIVQLLILIFVFGLIFNIREGFQLGYWNGGNYILFLLMAFCIQFSKSIISQYNLLFTKEKYWKTLGALMIAPINRFTLLIGVLFSELVANSIALIILFIIAWILYPISIFYIFLVLLVFFSIFLSFAGIGLLISVFSISHEELAPYATIILRVVFLFSCINYPMQIFPEIFQFLVQLNPFYYLFDLLRLTWYLGVDSKAAMSYITPIHIIIVLLMPIIIPIISIFLFNRLYKKYGIRGY